MTVADPTSSHRRARPCPAEPTSGDATCRRCPRTRRPARRSSGWSTPRRPAKRSSPAAPAAVRWCQRGSGAATAAAGKSPSRSGRGWSMPSQDPSHVRGFVSPSASPPADPCWLMTRRPATMTLMAALPASTKTSPAAAPVRPRANPLAPARRSHGPFPRRLRLRRRPAPRR
jgi:hypothetical protein